MSLGSLVRKINGAAVDISIHCRSLLILACSTLSPSEIFMYSDRISEKFRTVFLNIFSHNSHVRHMYVCMFSVVQLAIPCADKHTVVPTCNEKIPYTHACGPLECVLGIFFALVLASRFFCAIRGSYFFFYAFGWTSKHNIMTLNMKYYTQGGTRKNDGVLMKVWENITWL